MVKASRAAASLAVVALVCIGVGASAQPAPPERAPLQPAPRPGAGGEGAQASRDQPATGPTRFEDLPAPVKLGVRAEFLRRRAEVIRTVVIVPDGASYAAAVAGWSTRARYPVLIDDGSWGTGRNIARFVRAFRPDRVVRWSGGAALPAGGAERRGAIDRALAAAWEAGAGTAVIDHFRALQFSPPGVVAAQENDPAWTAALALAAWHGQPIVWIDGPGLPGRHISGATDLAAVDEISAQLSRAMSAMGLAWSGIGDQIDAVTLCLNGPAKVVVKDDGTCLAISDVIGRGTAGERTDRWAWAGQIMGSEPEAAYRAMSSAFLVPERAWLFDGYENAPPWNQWDATEAATVLEKANIAATVGDNGNQSAEEFRLRAAGRGRVVGAGDKAAEGGGLVDAGLIAVNTAGNPEYFDLLPGRCLAGDVPFLRVPAIVHFVHSWSATRPGDRSTVGGRWLERGAYAYVGSVHEPFLQAFQPTPNFIRRMVAPAPLGAAARVDGGPPWKIAVLGDPLLTIGPPAPRSTLALPLEGAVNVEDELAPALRESRFGAALRVLCLLGRDADAARLAASLVREKPERVNGEVALEAFEAVYAVLDLRTLAALGRSLPEGDSLPPEIIDMVWHAYWPTIGTLRADEVDLLRRNLRRGFGPQWARDGAEAAGAIRRTLSPEAAQQFIAETLRQMPDDATRAMLNDALRR